MIPYVECDPRGPQAQPERCKEQGIKAFPTWIVKDGGRREGVLSLDQLAELSRMPKTGRPPG